MESELNKILEKLKSELKHFPHLYRMDIHLHDDFRSPPVIAVCWRQWVYLKHEESDDFTVMTLESERQCVEVEYGVIETDYPIGILKLAIELKVRKYPEPCKGIKIDWVHINKSVTSQIQFPIGVNQ